MSNWMMSGGHVPRLCCKHDDSETPRRGANARRTSATVTGVVLVCSIAASLVEARDRGQYANANPEIKAWFDGLRSGRGPCCSDADGSAVSDVDWESHGGHYRVRIEGEWVDVPEEAVITEPNRVGRTMVWPIKGYMGLTIRCFMPGSMT